MSASNNCPKAQQRITPPSSFVNPPLTPPPTGEKAFVQAARVVQLFRDRKAGRPIRLDPWTRFQLIPGEYSEIQSRIERDESLRGYTRDKIRYDYDSRSLQLVVRMPTAVHELFIDGVEDAVRSQLKLIRYGSGGAAMFARRVQAARSTEIHFPVGDSPANTGSKHEPDASFWHSNAQYPGIIIEVACSQKRKNLSRLAEDYLLDSDASVQVVVGLDIEYGNANSRKATLSTWRTEIFHTSDGDELRVVQPIANEAFRDDQGNPTNHSGLRLWLMDFAYEELSRSSIENDDREITVSAQQLCQYLSEAESRTQGKELLRKHTIPSGIRKRKRS
ncbi:hypothetical protein BJ546DRAFT_690914 [Cryomyces antarcticus]|uniref:Restriction endonuclease domain-containing protein n=1 Tax=Cryomyces antarcticus TaxID=329879 RepID=A0ABR0LX37_9PEZI|nr:hypothetical protein LTR39_004465 [Cryomyces antarcticus]KAK5012178.1 hypothetical protein LTR60_004517 [Cryomyces antarcticus]KAK5254020.1 hypothetical protein LTR16_004949 [Cryomyces antarcticus]